MHIIVIIECRKKYSHVLPMCLGQFGGALGDIPNFRRDQVPTGGFQRFRDRIEVFDFGDEARAFLAFGSILGFQVFNFLCAGLDGIPFCVALEIGVRGLNDSAMIEKERYTAGLAEGSGEKKPADLRGRPIPIVRQAFDNNRHFVRREALVNHGFTVGYYRSLLRSFKWILMNI